MRLSTLPEWLAWIASIHTTEIDLGLDRVKAVAEKLGVLSFSCPIVIVGGTNGKGSTVAGLEAIYRAQGFRVGTFTSPILFRHNEQVRIHGQEADDAAFCAAFEKIEAVRGPISLTPFEYHTLAALCLFKQHDLDVLILEVGLGGRLDAVNCLDADVAIVTTIGIDHTEWLGSTRDAIAREKAGIFRAGRPAICGDVDPPDALIACAKEKGAMLFSQGKEFTYKENKSTWSWQHQTTHYDDLPRNALATQNMSTVLMAITLLQFRLPVTQSAIKQGLKTVQLRGRIEVMQTSPLIIFDVSHNPAAISHLADYLTKHPCTGKTHAVFSMLMDKDILTSIHAISDQVDHWYVAPLVTLRATSMEKLQTVFREAHIQAVSFFSSVQAAYRDAKKNAAVSDRVIAFGSFHVIAALDE